MIKSIKKLLKTTGAVTAGAAAIGAVAYATTKFLVKTAIDREQPDIMKKNGEKISGGKDNEEFKQLCKDAAQALRESEHELVEIMASDGTKLIGHFFPQENAKRIIIAFHGWRSSWDFDFGTISDFWENNGCSVLYAEQRGQNESGGEYIGFGLTERYDCVDWVNWVNCRCGKNTPIYLAGVSMGATTVLMASDLELPDNVNGIIADCAFTSPQEIFKHIAKNNLHISYGWRSSLVNTISRKKLNVGLDDYSTVKALENAKVPVLFIHGTDDHFVPVSMTYENYKACIAPKKLLIVPGAEHAMSYFINKSEYEKAVEDFWDEFDKANESNEGSTV